MANSRGNFLQELGSSGSPGLATAGSSLVSPLAQTCTRGPSAPVSPLPLYAACCTSPCRPLPTGSSSALSAAPTASGACSWIPNPAYLEQVTQLLSQATQPDSSIQHQLAEAFNQLLDLPDALCYLTTVLCGMVSPLPSVEVRQVAGLNLKNHLNTPRLCTSFVLDYMRPLVLKAIQDPEKVVRSTAGNVITTLICAHGASSWPEALECLLAAVEDPNQDVMDGAFSTLCKICEDELMMRPNKDSDNRFVTFCERSLLPKVFALCQAGGVQQHPNVVCQGSLSVDQSGTSRPATVLKYAVSCLTFFVQSHSFAPSAAFEQFFGEYWRTLGTLATNKDSAVRLAVVTGMVQVMHFNPEFVINSGDAVFDFMVECTGDSDYHVHLEAVEFWPTALRDTPCKQGATDFIRNHLPRLVPLLVKGTVYSEWDYLGMDQAQLEEDNAEVPDEANDVRPRFHHACSSKKEEDDEDNRGTWGGGWTVRKGSALALDHLANTFMEELLPDILPLVEARLVDSNWEIRESAVLTLGAVAQGCMAGLSPYINKVLDFLTKLCDEPKPLLRSISCWCLARFSGWVCANSDAWLKLCLAKILCHVLDRNKRVQEAACSAFATLEEEAREQLVLYLPEVVQTLTKAFEMYQAKNLLILYDAVGTLADSVHTSLQDEALSRQLMAPLSAKWNSFRPSDPSTVALYECMSNCATAMQQVFAPYARPVVERCLSMIALALKESADRNAANVERSSSPDLVECSLDLLSGVTVALSDQMPLLLSQINCDPSLPLLLTHCCKDLQSHSVLQSSFALVGDLSKHCVDILKPNLNELFPLLISSLHHPSAAVSNNAGWAIGELCLRIPDETLQRHVPAACNGLVTLLLEPTLHRSLLQNVCITLGRLSLRSSEQLSRIQGQFLKPWCLLVQGARNDQEKAHAFQGICGLIMINSYPASDCLGELVTAMVTFRQCPPPLEEQFLRVLTGLKEQYPEKWKSLWETAPIPLKEEVLQRFRLDSC